jgi:hypothetical protein
MLTPNVDAHNFTKNILLDLIPQTDLKIVVVGDFSTPLSPKIGYPYKKSKGSLTLLVGM